jgi:hypothetical protein
MLLINLKPQPLTAGRVPAYGALDSDNCFNLPSSISLSCVQRANSELQEARLL